MTPKTFEEYRQWHEDHAPAYPYLDKFGPEGPHWHRTEFYLKYIRPTDKVLDCGCSNGGLAKYLTEQVGCHVTAIDIATFFVENTKKNAPKAECFVRPIEDTKFEDALFDVVIAGEILEHVLDLDKALKEILRILKPGGTLLATTPAKPDDNELHLRYIGRKEFEEVLPGATIVENIHSWLVAYEKAGPLKVYWIGYGGNSVSAEELRPMITELGMTLTTIHEWDNADIKWDRNTWLGHLKRADIIIVPANYQTQPAKSNNRLTQALSLGKPVICSPLDAYLQVLEKHPGCCLIATDQDEWKQHLESLKDLEIRRELGQRALIAAKGYSLEAIGSKWLSAFQDTKKVDIVIPTYKNLRGLKLCLDSIRACTDVMYRITVVNNGLDEELHKYLSEQGDITYIKRDRCNFAQAVNAGIKAGKNPYVMILNDDVIVSKGWLRHMLDACKGKVGVVGPLSNCDKGWTHNLSFNIGGVELLPGVNTFEQIIPIIPQIYAYQSPYTNEKDLEWVAFYCTLIRREALDKAGLLNEEFTNSGEDVDLCRRIRQQGYKILQTYRSFVFHQGAVSRKLLEAEDPGSYHAADKKTNEHLNALWGRKSVVIYTGPMWQPWDFRNVDEGGIGGSETWAVMLARELQKLDYRVTVFADCPQRGLSDGDIPYLHYTEYPQYIEQHWIDYFISSRTTDTLRFPIRAGKVFVMIHDVWLLSEKTQLFLDKVDKFCVLSKWHWDFVKDYHKIPEDKLALTSNGICFDKFDSIQVERHPHRLHWSSSLDRGLDNVLYLFPFIKKSVPDLELHIFYGTLNWRKSCEQKGDKEGLKKIDELEQAMCQEGVYYHGRVGQKDLAIETKKASLWLYPTWFTETFSITALECQRSGLPVLANKFAGIITTVGDSGILLGNGEAYWPYSKEGREQFLNQAIKLMTDQYYWREWSEKGFKNTEKYSWADVARRWKEEMFHV